MGVTKTDQYTEEQVKVARMLKALGHPARVAILESIIASNACVCGELVTQIGLAQATVSQHLRELKNAELIQGTIEGTSVCYCANDGSLKLLESKLSGFVKRCNTDSDCC